MRDRKLLSMFLLLIAYTLPIVVGLLMTGQASVVCGYIAMLLNFVVFLAGHYFEADNEIERRMQSSVVTLAFGVAVTITVLSSQNPNVLWLTLAMAILSAIVYAITSSYD